MKQRIIFFICLIGFSYCKAQVKPPMHRSWLVTLERKDGKQVPFQMEQQLEKGQIVLYIINAKERIKITNIEMAGDSLFFTLPAFESSFRLQMLPGGDMKGVYIKGTSETTQY